MDVLDSYVAGFFDGEGCISSQESWIPGKYEKFPRINLQISITNTDKEVLNLIRGRFGGQISKHTKKTGKLCYAWKLTGKDKMRVFLLSVLPYLIVKKEQALLALEFIDTLRKENLGCVPLPKEVHELRYKIHLALRKRKSKSPSEVTLKCKAPKLRGNPNVKSRAIRSQASDEEGSTTIMEPSQDEMMG